MRMMMDSRERRKVKMLQRRLALLEKRIAEKTAALQQCAPEAAARMRVFQSFDLAEAAALRWAISIVTSDGAITVAEARARHVPREERAATEETHDDDDADDR